LNACLKPEIKKINCWRVKMRTLQFVLFGIGAVSFLAAIFFIGADAGDILWRLGIAVLLLDLVCIQLWSASPKLN
jgi:hypothetical protein